MPALSPTMTEGSVTTWMKKEGETFVAGEVLLSIETDKASIDVEAQDDGILGKIIVSSSSFSLSSLLPLLLPGTRSIFFSRERSLIDLIF